jgi:hypothetical protein
MAGGFNLKLTFCFMETTHELLPLHKVLYNERSWTNRFVLLESLFSLTELFNMVMVEIQMSEVDAKTAPVNVGPSNFVC